MSIHVNGSPTDLEPGLPLAEVLARLDLDRPHVAVAVDGAVLPRSAWGTAIPDGARIEVVTATAGG